MFNRFEKFKEDALMNGIYIVAMHATRIPPHVGLIIDKQYHSLNIKGQDINTSVKALLKTIEQRKIPSLFIRIKSHSTFSHTYLKEHFILNIQQFPRVDAKIASCLSPIKLFFHETYNVSMDDVHFLFHLLPHLQAQGLIEHSSTLFIDEKNYQLPIYTQEELDYEIEKARSEINATLSSSVCLNGH